MKVSQWIVATSLISMSVCAQSFAADSLECTLKTMNPSGESQVLQTKSAALSTGASVNSSGAEVEFSASGYTARAVLETVQSYEVFFIDIQDSSGRESGLQTNGSAIRGSKLSSTLKVSPSGDWVYVECDMKS